MPSSIISPNMSLIIPAQGVEPGPNYAIDINNSLNLIDQHDHSPGRGVQINPAGILINANLDFHGFDIINLNNLVLLSQSNSSVLQALYVKPGTETPAIQDLWYNDSAGNAVQLTFNGAVNATIASIPGESYAAGTFFWKQGTGSTTPANFDIGSITLRPNVALTTNGVVLGPPSGIGSQYNINLPLLPVSTQVVTISPAGVMSTSPSLLPSNSGSQGQFLRQNSTGGTIYQNLMQNIQTITGDYSPTPVDDLIFCSSNPISITLYTAVGNTGKVLTIKKTDISLANIVILAPNGLETIDGYSDYKLTTYNESVVLVSDGTNWKILDHACNTADSTTVLGSLSYSNITTTSDFLTMRRVGDNLYARGSSLVATTTAAAFSINLPSGLAIDTTKINTISNGIVVGAASRVNAAGVNFPTTSGGEFPLFFDGSTTNKIFLSELGSSNTYQKRNGASFTSTNDVISFEFVIPIVNWFP